MTAAASGIWNHAAPDSGPLTAKPQSGAAAGNSGDSSTTSATISANDFLTLLVTELQNQDPTAQTDPNEYVNQLVSVNSLEQLIQINQTLNAATGSGSGGGSGTPGAVPPPATGHSAQSAAPSPQHSPALQHPAPLAPGNLAIPQSHPAAQTVAQALSGRAR